VYQTADIEPESQDMVTMFHTLEHLDDPLDAMRRARVWLGARGFLVIEVPNVEAICQEPHRQFHRGHLYHFNLRSLEEMGRRAGFAVSSSGTSSDGGNIWTILQKHQGPWTPDPGIAGNCERVRGILGRHSSLRHALSRYPYVRPVKRLIEWMEERRRLRVVSDPRLILDRLVASRHAARALDAPVR
jgi:hypothetical protein